MVIKLRRTSALDGGAALVADGNVPVGLASSSPVFQHMTVGLVEPKKQQKEQVSNIGNLNFESFKLSCQFLESLFTLAPPRYVSLITQAA